MELSEAVAVLMRYDASPPTLEGSRLLVELATIIVRAELKKYKEVK